MTTIPQGPIAERFDSEASAGEPCVYAIATLDTKGAELSWLTDLLRRIGVAVRTVDVGTLDSPTVVSDVSREEVLAGRVISETDRGEAVTEMGEALREFLVAQNSRGQVSGVVGLGGSGGTALITAAMRALPIGLPKLMVSTVASGNTAPYVDGCDILMMHSVVDIAGLNAVSENILANAAHAMAGMVTHPRARTGSRPALGMTMFGVTTPCVTRVREMLEQNGYDPLVFHATGAGGRAMERLVESGLIGGVLDLTTTEVADELVGGVFPGGPERFDRLLAARIPVVVSLGAVDMVNFGAPETIPPRFSDRRFHRHNAQVTLMRTTPDENRVIGRWIAEKLNRSVAPLRLLIPEGGVSALDAPGQPFHDPAANAALFEGLSGALRATSQRRLIRLPHHINDPEFADAVVRHFSEIAAAAPTARDAASER
ncbi:MAG: UPF0261 family protein [Planctomycetaceae bacterium]|nr:MAG: UPF0261 family protein [Planctomycetaceae bacterium]